MGKHIHILSEVDPPARTAICAHCGPVRVRRAGGDRWRCPVASNEHKRYAGEPNRNGRPYRKSVGSVCTECGFVPEHVSQLDVHHIDGDHSNNSEANLSTICANCHRLVHAPREQ